MSLLEKSDSERPVRRIKPAGPSALKQIEMTAGETQPETGKKKRRPWIYIAALILAAVSGVFIYSATKKTNVLLVGIDAVDRYAHRADTIIVANYHPANHTLVLISVPRDTMTELPGKGRMKINEVYAYGLLHGDKDRATELLAEQIGSLLGMRITNYIQVDYKGFVECVNLLGGVRVTVPHRMKYHDRAAHLKIDIPAGVQVLSGRKALDYVRFRSDRLGDIGRIKRQQQFLEAVYQKVKQPDILMLVPKMVQQILPYIKTNMSLADMVVLAERGSRLESDRVRMISVPGEPVTMDKHDYWVADKDKFKEILETVLAEDERSKEFKMRDKSTIKIEILNGCGKAGVAKKMTDMLRKSGFDVVNTENADHFGYARTLAIDRTGLKVLGSRVAEEIKIKEDCVLSKPDPTRVVDVSVVIGQDFK